MKFLLYFISFLMLAVQSDTYFGKVINIIDGDIIILLAKDEKQIKVRLEGIDCPEMKQDFGSRAKQATSDLRFGKQVRVIKSGEDRYGRTLGYVYVGDVCVNRELLKLGLALHYKYFSKDT